MWLPRLITLLALAASAVAGVIAGWAWRAPSGSSAVLHVRGANPGQAVASHPDEPPAASSLTAAKSAMAGGDFAAFLETLERVAAHDLPRLWASASGRFPLTSDWHSALLDRWAEVAPEAGLQALAGHELGAVTFSQVRATLFTAWAGYQPMEAAAALARIPIDDPGRRELNAAVLAVLVTDHPATLLREAAAMKSVFPDEYDFRAPEAAATLAFRDPELAVALADTISGHDRGSIRLGLVLGWAGLDPSAAEAWVATWPEADQDSGWQIIARVLAAQDPEAAGRLMARIGRYAHPIDLDKPSYGKLAMYTWPFGSRDPLEIILPRQLREDPAAAQEWARRYIPAQADYQIARSLASAPWASLEAAMATLTRLDTGVLTETAKAGGLATLAQEVVDRLDDLTAQFSPSQQEAARTVLLASAARELPELAAPRLLDLPPTAMRQHVLEEAFENWVDRALDTATSWLGSLPAGELRDRLVWRSIERTASADPPAAWSWLMTTADTPQRTNCYDYVLAVWARADASAARAALDALAVEAKTRQYLREVVEEHSR